MTADFFTATNGPEDPLRDDLIAMIVHRYVSTPRHLQRELGPSEVGHPCMRRMAFGMMEAPKCNPELDPLYSIHGTAMHTWLQDAAAKANEKLGRERWIAESKVDVAPGLFGHSDLYDCDTATVIDWKYPGKTRFDIYKANPGPTFINQVMMYGKGFENAGYVVKCVAIAFLPRAGTLHRMHVWSADYDPEIADAVLRRREAVIGLLDDLDVEHNPERYEWIPISPYDCVASCRWFRPEPAGPCQCRGDQ